MEKANKKEETYIVGPNASYVHKGISYKPGDNIPKDIFPESFFERQVGAGKIIVEEAETEAKKEEGKEKAGTSAKESSQKKSSSATGKES